MSLQSIKVRSVSSRGRCFPSQLDWGNASVEMMLESCLAELFILDRYVLTAKVMIYDSYSFHSRWVEGVFLPCAEASVAVMFLCSLVSGLSVICHTSLRPSVAFHRHGFMFSFSFLYKSKVNYQYELLWFMVFVPCVCVCVCHPQTHQIHINTWFRLILVWTVWQRMTVWFLSALQK